ncbi:MAG: efflux RND transporter periplasmic adaptor subunit [Deltaproteobacteria bacterium]|nr:efflux RND transporter periplasmic adaptor subunit [Deltaproteobacteria bacterium]
MSATRSSTAGRGHAGVAGAPAVMLLLVLLAATGCDKGGAKAAAAQEPPKTVRVEKIGRADIEEVLSYPADLVPAAEVRVFSLVPDRILSFPHEDGDEVRRGERLAVVRTDAMSQGLAQMGAQIEALDVQIRNSQAELERLKGLFAAGAVAKAELDRAETAYLATAAQRRALESGRGQLAVNAGNGVIVAPMAGVVADKSAIVGDTAAPGLPLCRIMAVDALKVKLRLVERDVPKVRLGQKVVLHLDAFPGRSFEGEVTLVLPYLDRQTRTNSVDVTVRNPKDPKTRSRLLKPGMFGRAELVVERRSGVLVAPEPALLLDNAILAQQKPGETLRKAFVVDAQGVARGRLVRLGARQGTVYEVLGGLKEGERLVLRGQHGLRDGQNVEIVEAAGR